jgi:hypothetical protein
MYARSRRDRQPEPRRRRRPTASAASRPASRPRSPTPTARALADAGVTVIVSSDQGPQTYDDVTLVDQPSTRSGSAPATTARSWRSSPTSARSPPRTCSPRTRGRDARRVQRRLQGRLLQHKLRGSLFGDTPADAFRVETGPPINTPTAQQNRQLKAAVAREDQPEQPPGRHPAHQHAAHAGALGGRRGTQDTIRTTASLNGTPLGEFRTFSGGELTSADTKSARAAGQTERSRGGRKTIGNVTISRELPDLDDRASTASTAASPTSSSSTASRSTTTTTRSGRR